MTSVIQGGLIVAAVIHLLPVMGVLGVKRLESMYGVELAGPDLVILMRHRAVLFGLLGVFLLLAVFQSTWRSPALVAGLISVVAFLALAWTAEGYNGAIRRVVVADLVALVALLAAGAAHLLSGDASASL